MKQHTDFAVGTLYLLNNNDSVYFVNYGAMYLIMRDKGFGVYTVTLFGERDIIMFLNEKEALEVADVVLDLQYYSP
jgi:hypothetical protein